MVQPLVLLPVARALLFSQKRGLYNVEIQVRELTRLWLSGVIRELYYVVVSCGAGCLSTNGSRKLHAGQPHQRIGMTTSGSSPQSEHVARSVVSPSLKSHPISQIQFTVAQRPSSAFSGRATPHAASILVSRLAPAIRSTTTQPPPCPPTETTAARRLD